jgi:hypothetical protein
MVAIAAVDISSLSEQQAQEYRRELIEAICHPGIEFDMTGAEGADDLQAYRARVAEVDAYIETFAQY